MRQSEDIIIFFEGKCTVTIEQSNSMSELILFHSLSLFVCITGSVNLHKYQDSAFIFVVNEVPFEEVTESVATRSVYIQKGHAYVVFRKCTCCWLPRCLKCSAKLGLSLELGSFAAEVMI